MRSKNWSSFCPRITPGVLARILLRDFTIQFESDLGWAQLELKFLKTLTLAKESSNHTRGDDHGAFVPLIGHQVKVLISCSLPGYFILLYSSCVRIHALRFIYATEEYACFVVNIITPCWHWTKDMCA